MRCDESTRSSVIEDYNSKVLTVEQIVQKYGIARRTVYNWVSANHGRKNNIDRKAVYLSRDEVETMLLLIMVGENDVTEKQKCIAKALEKRLLDIADEFSEVS